MKLTRRACVSPTHYPRISLDKLTIDSLHKDEEEVKCSQSYCCQVPSKVDNSGTNPKLPGITQEMMHSVEAQLELLRHELFLAKKQVKERNSQIIKLEHIINNQKVELKHHCDGSSNLMKIMDVLYGAVDTQNKQVESMRNIKKRLISLEGSSSVFHKPGCGLQLSTNLYNPKDPPVIRHCKTMDDCSCQTLIKTTANSLPSPGPSSGSKATKVHKTTITEDISEASHGFDTNRSNKHLEELEKQKMINCQLNEHLMKLQEEIKLLKLKIEKHEENQVAALRSSASLEKEKQSLVEQISVLTKQNGKLQGHVSQIDRERDKALRELDSSDETISRIEIEVHRANAEARKLECQLKTTTSRCGKLEELLANSEKIASSLRKQKTHLENDVGRVRSETEALRKSYEVMRSKYKKTCNSFHVCKRKLWKANEEKVILQSQIQEYVSRVRHIEDLLLQKEQEREFIFQQFQELTAKDNCRNDFIDMTDDRVSPHAADTPLSSDSVDVANAETQTAALKETGAGYSGSDHSRKFFQEQAYGTPLGIDQEAINTTLIDSSVSKKGQLTHQLDIMGKTVQSLESKVQMIGKSLESCQKKCVSQEQRNSRRYSAGSSLSTML